MQKIVAGIVVVFCLQAMFQAYLAVEQSHDEYQAMARSTPLTDALGDFPVETASVDQALPAADEITTETASLHRAARPAQHEMDYAAYRRPAFPRISQFAETREFRTVTINIPAPVRYMDASYVRQPVPAAMPAAKKEKRSLPAKTLAVIKKPFDWLKAFASKFKG